MPEIIDKHKEFARAVVALAREHGANHLSVEFDFASSKAFREYPDIRNSKMHFSWSEGRHGAKQEITLNASETVHMREQIESEQ